MALPYYRVKFAADKCGVARTTLLSAISRGEIPVENTLCGLPLVNVRDVRKWLSKSDQRSPGRPAKS